MQVKECVIFAVHLTCFGVWPKQRVRGEVDVLRTDSSEVMIESTLTSPWVFVTITSADGEMARGRNVHCKGRRNRGQRLILLHSAKSKYHDVLL